MEDKNGLTIEEVEHISKLANLYLSDEEKEKFRRELSQTLKYVRELSEINTANVKPTFNVNKLENIYREDSILPSLSQEEALKNAKNTYNGFFKVKAVLEEK